MGKPHLERIFRAVKERVCDECVHNSEVNGCTSRNRRGIVQQVFSGEILTLNHETCPHRQTRNNDGNKVR